MGADLTGYGNPVANPTLLKFAGGPHWWPYHTSEFTGSRDDVIEIANNNMLNTKYAITVTAHIYSEKGGVLLAYKTDSKPGFSLSLVGTRLKISVPSFDGRRSRALITRAGTVKKRMWTHVAGSYHQDGTLRLYVDGVLQASSKVDLEVFTSKYMGQHTKL